MVPSPYISAFIAHLQNSRLPSCKSTVSKVTSNYFWYRIIWPDWSNRRWQQFSSILSITERGVMPHFWTVMLTILLTQDEVMLRTRLSQISSFLFRSGRVFLVLTFMGWGCRSGWPIMDESEIAIFLVSSVAPLSMGRLEIFDFFWVLCQWIDDMCHDLILRKSRRFA